MLMMVMMMVMMMMMMMIASVTLLHYLIEMLERKVQVNSRYRQYVKDTRMSLSRFVSDALWDSLVTHSLPVRVAGTLADAACVRACVHLY